MDAFSCFNRIPCDVTVKLISNQQVPHYHVSETGLQQDWSQSLRMRQAESCAKGRPPFDIVIIYSLSPHHNPQRLGVSSTPLKYISASVSSSAQNDWVTFMRLMRGCHCCLGEAKSNVQQDYKSTCNLWQWTSEYDTYDLSSPVLACIRHDGTVADDFIIQTSAIVKV